MRCRLLAVVGALVGCSLGGGTNELHDGGVAFRYPDSWHVAGFSTTNSPRRTAVASYRLPEDAVEGDCGGTRAVELLPRDGALVVVDYGSGASFAPRSADVELEDGQYAEYECFGASTMLRFRVGDRDFQAHVALGPEADDPLRDQALAILESIEVDEPEPFVPETWREGDRMVMPVVFPDGTTAELVYPPKLELERFMVRPYGSGSLAGVGARDFSIYAGDVEDVLTTWNRGAPPERVAEYEDARGESVGLWRVRRADTVVDYLGFQFGRWAVLVYDYVGDGSLYDAGRAAWVASFRGRETDDGWLLLEADEPLRLARAGEHAGPELSFARGNPSRSLELFPGPCAAHRDQERVVAGKRVHWRGGFADWCMSEEMRAHATGNRAFVGALIRELAVRDVALAG